FAVANHSPKMARRPQPAFRPWLCKNSTRYDRTRNFGLYGHAESKKTQKFVFRSALRPNQISFSHGHVPKRRSPQGYIWRVIFNQPVSAGSSGVHHLKPPAPWLALTKGSPVARHDATLIGATDAVSRTDPVTITKEFCPGGCLYCGRALSAA